MSDYGPDLAFGIFPPPEAVRPPHTLELATLAHVRGPAGTRVALPDEDVRGVVERGAGLLVLLELPTLLADQRLIIQQEVA